jgi:hypothetical protein
MDTPRAKRHQSPHRRRYALEGTARSHAPNPWVYPEESTARPATRNCSGPSLTARRSPWMALRRPRLASVPRHRAKSWDCPSATQPGSMATSYRKRRVCADVLAWHRSSSRLCSHCRSSFPAASLSSPALGVQSHGSWIARLVCSFVCVKDPTAIDEGGNSATSEKAFVIQVVYG